MVKVTVCGAAGGIGQPLSMLLKLNPQVSHLSLFDIVNARGVAADLSHVNTSARVTGHQPSSKDDKSAIVDALTDSDIVVIPAGVPRKPGMTRADLFNINALIIRDLIANVGKTCPNATILIISNPVNATVAIAASVLKKLGIFNPRKLLGVTTLDSVRAETFLGGLIGETPHTLKGKISVIGGHSGDTIVPLIHFDSSISAKVKDISETDYIEYVRRVQFGGDEVVKAKNGAGSATLSMAYAGYRFTEYVLDSFANKISKEGIPDSAYIYLPGVEGGINLSASLGVEFFSVPVVLRAGEVASFHAPEKLLRTKTENEMVRVAIDGLKGSIAQGINFVEGSRL
ncbi:malate dehydrogenase [Metschnikowia bicuspidata var. bicuspidata NRRL YB-4993]|uniref:Malate dehydrogenase n=1 Tax=Metschnikowia bicuspidata var. bicuspidata NRRL YB-4993 TaxID=869754 RepID=A0A1A0HI54_9ASCO|nr:malate dehydrogenase [Metschnikowia bicuspidata var. bicuspidata NRRL YB-4993]OBA23685.1 malate dehydrogenase [Metschnikowia bicuspidata var. bicuspidata NRRL YB-4993]